MANLEDSASAVTTSSDKTGNEKAKAYDGDTGTSWLSNNDGINSWIKFEWASSVTIREIRLIGGANLGWPRFTFADNTYIEGGLPITTAGADITYAFSHPVTTTSVKIGIAPSSGPAGETGFREIEIKDTYTSAPSTNLTIPDWLTVISQYDNSYPRFGVLDAGGMQWASNNGGASSWIQWNWLQAVSVSSIQLQSRAGGDTWGTPRFTFSDASTVDGGGAVSNTGLTTYTFSPAKTTTSLKVSIVSGGAGNNGFVQAIVTGNVTPPSAGRTYGPAVQ